MLTNKKHHHKLSGIHSVRRNLIYSACSLKRKYFIVLYCKIVSHTFFTDGKRAKKIHTNMGPAVKAAVEDGMSVSAAARQFNIPRVTLYDHTKGKYFGYDTAFGRERALTDEEESILVKYLVYMGESGFPLTRKMMKMFVIHIIKNSGRETSVNMDKGPSYEWIRNFLKRNQDELRARTVHPVTSQYVAVGQPSIDNFYKLLEEQLKLINNDPSRLYNMDETGFSRDMRQKGQVIAPKGVRQAFKVELNISGHITVVMAISASGQVLPPKIVYSKSLPRGDFRTSVPCNWTFSTSKSGFVNGDIINHWFESSFLPSIDTTRPVLLTLDNLSSHFEPTFIDACMKNDVHLLFLPANTSLILQPLDVSLFHPLKQIMCSLASGYCGPTTVPRNMFPVILQQALSDMSVNTVKNAFKNVGFSPFDNDKVKAIGQKRRIEVPEDAEIDICEKCHQPTENILVRCGLIPASLSHILVPKKTRLRPGCFNHQRKPLMQGK